MNLIRNENNLIKVMILADGYQFYPDNPDLRYIYITDEEFEKIKKGDYTLENGNLRYEPDYKKKYAILYNEMKLNDWKQLRAYRRYMLNGSITQEDRDILNWYNEKSIELESYRDKL